VHISPSARHRLPPPRVFHRLGDRDDVPGPGRPFGAEYSGPQGELVITGEPSMKPYDQVFLYDSYNDMSGPIEVEQVTHIFSQETGFVTVITPDLVVQTNEYLSMSLVDSLATYMGSVWLGYRKKQFASGQVGALELGDLPWTGEGDLFPKQSK
jgi:hypothetical protein